MCVPPLRPPACGGSPGSGFPCQAGPGHGSMHLKFLLLLNWGERPGVGGGSGGGGHPPVPRACRSGGLCARTGVCALTGGGGLHGDHARVRLRAGEPAMDSRVCVHPRGAARVSACVCAH